MDPARGSWPPIARSHHRRKVCAHSFHPVRCPGAALLTPTLNTHRTYSASVWRPLCFSAATSRVHGLALAAGVRSCLKCVRALVQLHEQLARAVSRSCARSPSFPLYARVNRRLPTFVFLVWMCALDPWLRTGAARYHSRSSTCTTRLSSVAPPSEMCIAQPLDAQVRSFTQIAKNRSRRTRASRRSSRSRPRTVPVPLASSRRRDPTALPTLRVAMAAYRHAAWGRFFRRCRIAVRRLEKLKFRFHCSGPVLCASYVLVKCVGRGGAAQFGPEHFLMGFGHRVFLQL